VADETKARHTLADMQAKIARSAYDALGITAGDVGADHVRAAFLMLTKQFHPAKFARMAPDIQKLANEVFLGLRAAHDQLARPSKGLRSSGPIPIVKTPAPELLRNASGVRPNGTPVAQDPRNASGVRLAPQPATQPIRPPGTQPGQRAPSPPITTTRAPSPPITTTRAPSPPITAQRPPTAQPQRPSSQPIPGQRPGSPAAPTQSIRRTPPGGVPVIKQAAPAATSTRAGTAPIPATPAPANAEPELAGVYDLLQKGQFEQARTTLNALIALQPRARYRALHQYSIAREAQLARRLDDARVDLLGALEIDPELQLAKTALAELFTRRK
jgi:hypothetical protein